jgi:hypothetical protein
MPGSVESAALNGHGVDGEDAAPTMISGASVSGGNTAE